MYKECAERAHLESFSTSYSNCSIVDVFLKEMSKNTLPFTFLPYRRVKYGEFVLCICLMENMHSELTRTAHVFVYHFALQ